ncbi:NXPE family member 1-like [Amphiura filiformis]|uniref:NXPE family member 1-like n=1 Tax=Amphiura filiformis TaxID=82378 RepID=UPI003B215AC8
MATESAKRLKSRRGGKLRFLLLFQIILGLLVSVTGLWYLVTTDAHILVLKPIKKMPSQFYSTKHANHSTNNLTDTGRKPVSGPGTRAVDTTNKTADSGITSAAFSCYRLVTPQEQITKGSLLHFIIEAHDESQQPMPSGGDFLLATMSTTNPYKASTAGRIVDHNNGTYSVYFYAAWSGNVEINVTLVNPSKAVRFLRDTMWNIGPKVFWSATFQNMTIALFSNKTFDTNCWVEHWKDVTSFDCKYPAPNALGDYVFVCHQAVDGLCRPLDVIEMDAKMSNKFTDEAAGENTRYFERKYFNQRLLKGPQVIAVSDNNTTLATNIANLVDQSSKLSHGYWMNKKWTSFVYTNHWTDASDIQNCLRNKHMLLLGDSTTRQWAENLSELLDLVNGIYREEIRELFFENEFPQINFTYTFRFHPHAITAKRAPYRLYRYFVDILDSISSYECANTIVVLSPWAHFAQWTRDSYTQRLVKLKEAVDRLKKRCPATPIIVKGSHIREHYTETSKWGWSDYVLLQINILMKEIFTGKGIWFLDVWDMNLSYLSTKFIHMPNAVVQEELKLALAYVCKR